MAKFIKIMLAHGHEVKAKAEDKDKLLNAISMSQQLFKFTEGRKEKIIFDPAVNVIAVTETDV